MTTGTIIFLVLIAALVLVFGGGYSLALLRYKALDRPIRN
jgi:hypothetical protein